MRLAFSSIKKYMVLAVKAVVISSVVLQTTSAATGNPLVDIALAEPFYLSLCGIALLYLGLYKRKQQS